MGKSQDDPWAQPDPALAYALQQLAWYASHRGRSRLAAWVFDVAIVVVGAATTLAAALEAEPGVTASLAATSLALTGLTKIFGPRENWIARAKAWADVFTIVNQYRILQPEQRDDAARRKLVESVDEIVARETTGWAARRSDALRSR